MFIKKSIDKDHYDKDGYTIIDTDLEYNQNFNDLIEQIDNDLKIKIKNLIIYSVLYIIFVHLI